MNDESRPPYLPPRMIEKSATEARQAVTTGRVRWVLAISLLLGIAGLAVAYWVA